MLKNIFIYIAVLVSAFVFNIFFYDWFSWYLLVLVLCVPLLSLVLSLPFMISHCVKGISVSAQKELTLGEPLIIRMVPNIGRKSFCPFMKIRFRISNSFARQNKTVKFLYSGLINTPIFLETNSVTSNCGLLEISAKYCKIYDLLGIFFIPVKLDYNAEVLVNPKPQPVNASLYEVRNKIIGYKKKLSGYAEEYELRNYQQGDSLKNIHWKISARHNDLVVKEPCTPIYRPILLNPTITSNPTKNNVMLGRLISFADLLIENHTEIYCALPNGAVCKISDKNEVKSYLLQLYKNEYSQGLLCIPDNPLIYKITHETEAVSAN